MSELGPRREGWPSIIRGIGLMSVAEREQTFLHLLVLFDCPRINEQLHNAWLIETWGC